MVSINNQGHVWKRQTVKCWGMSCSFISWPEGLCSLCKRMATWLRHGPCFLPLSHEEDEDTPTEVSWTTDSNLAEVLWRAKLLRLRWGSGIHWSSCSIGLWTKFWSRSAWEWLFQFICFELFLPVCILLFLLEWNTKQNLPDIQTALLMTHWPTPWL